MESEPQTFDYRKKKLGGKVLIVARPARFHDAKQWDRVLLDDDVAAQAICSGALVTPEQATVLRAPKEPEEAQGTDRPGQLRRVIEKEALAIAAEGERRAAERPLIVGQPEPTNPAKNLVNQILDLPMSAEEKVALLRKMINPGVDA